MAEKNHSKSKKISELQAWTVVPEHQNHSWIPVAQYDSRVHAYTNIAINVNAITSYSINTVLTYNMDKLSYIIDYATTINAYTSEYAYAYTTDRYYENLSKIEALNAFSKDTIDSISDLYTIKNEWINFRNIKNGTNYDEVAAYINADPVATALVSYSFSYTMKSFDWQKINGTRPWIVTNSNL